MRSWWVIACLVAVSGAAVAADKPKAPASADSARPAKPTAAEAPVAPAGSDAAAPADAQDAASGDAAQPSVPHIVGPKRVDLGHGAQIDLPAGMLLVERAAAQELLRKGGNEADDAVAMIVPDGPGDWAMVIEAEDVGYVSDSDAGELDAADMLEDFKRGTIEQNKKRVAMGIPELFIDGWSEPPRYERATRQLVWGLTGHGKADKVVNRYTRLLGRNGYLSVDLIDDPKTIEASKVQAQSILAALHFTPGSRYEDHTGSDHDSGLGLKALVLGGAGVVIAKKTGILIALLLVLKKGFIVVAAAFGGFFKWLFGRKSRRDNAVAELPPDLGAPPPG